MGTVRFVLRDDKPDSNGLCPVQLVYQVSGQRKYFGTEHRMLLENWDTKRHEVIYVDTKSFRPSAKNKNEKLLLEHLGKGASAPLLREGVDYNSLLSKREVDEINGRLARLESEIVDIEKRFVLNGEPYTAEMVVGSLKDARTPETKKQQSSRVLFSFIDKYITDHKTTRKAGSLTVYKSLKTHLEAFQKKIKRSITFDSIDYSFFQEFQNFLIDEQKLNNTTVAKQLSTVKTFINYARLHGVAVSEKYKDFKIKRETLEVIALTGDEFESLFNIDLAGNSKLARVRDVFCFSCVTGLRYSDLKQLSRVHIGRDEIRLTVTKTGEPLSIPLNPYARQILSRYADQPKPLPVITNQRMNEYIKDLCELAEIDEPTEIVRFRGARREKTTYPKHELISMHTGRKTFATLSLERGMSAEEVMAITGHLDYKSFMRYVKITDARKKLVMGNAWKMREVEKARKAII